MAGMAAALIRIDQAAHPTVPVGTAGRARDDILVSQTVTLVNNNNTGVRSWRWEIVDQPDIAAPVALSNPTAASPTFVPSATPGTYLIQLTVNEGRTGEKIRTVAAIRDSNGLRIPAAGEQSEANWDDASGSPNPRGWQPEMRLTLEAASASGPAAEYVLDFSTLASETLADAQVTAQNGLAWTVQLAAADDLSFVSGIGLRAQITDTNTTYDGNSATCSYLQASFADIYARLSAIAGSVIDVRNRIEIYLQYASPPTDDNNQIVGIGARGISGTPASSSGRLRGSGFEHDGTRQNVVTFSDTLRDLMRTYDTHDTAGLILGPGVAQSVWGIWAGTLDGTNFDVEMAHAPPQTTEPIKIPDNLLGIFFRGTASSSYVSDVESVTIRAYL